MDTKKFENYKVGDMVRDISDNTVGTIAEIIDSHWMVDFGENFATYPLDKLELYLEELSPLEKALL